MSTAERFHRRLKIAALTVAAVNLVSIVALDQREWLVYFDPWWVIAVLFPTFVIGLPALAFLVATHRAAAAPISTWLWLALAVAALLAFEAVWFFLIGVGAFFRGPDWSFYWPWEPRTPKITPLNTANFSEYVWIFRAGGPMPTSPLVRESPGLVLLAVHFLVVPLTALGLLRLVSPQMAWWRILLFVLIVQALAFAPLKMLLRWTMNWKYIVTFPDLMLNI